MARIDENQTNSNAKYAHMHINKIIISKRNIKSLHHLVTALIATRHPNVDWVFKNLFRGEFSLQR